MSAAAIILDVNETLFPLTPIRDRMAAAGIAPQRLEPWFRAVLVDGMAAAAADGPASFAALARHHLEVELEQAGRASEPEAVTGILAGFEEVVPHADVLPALELLDRREVEVALLTNGSAEIVRGFVERSGLHDLVASVWDVGEAGRWKPHPAPYRWAVEQLALAADQVAMVAVHPWDVHGAKAAGLLGGWLNRSGRGRYPPGFHAPDQVAHSLPELVERLTD